MKPPARSSAHPPHSGGTRRERSAGAVEEARRVTAEGCAAVGQRVYLGLGSNIGDRYGHLIDALDRLQACLAIDAISSIYETEPWGYADQPRFLNAVCGGETDLSPQELLGAVKAVE